MSVTALSQSNTNIMLRIRTPYDLDFLGRTSESIDRSVVNMLPSLDIGEALLVGEAINFPVFFEYEDGIIISLMILLVSKKWRRILSEVSLQKKIGSRKCKISFA